MYGTPCLWEWKYTSKGTDMRKIGAPQQSELSISKWWQISSMHRQFPAELGELEKEVRLVLKSTQIFLNMLWIKEYLK